MKLVHILALTLLVGCRPCQRGFWTQGEKCEPECAVPYCTGANDRPCVLGPLNGVTVLIDANGKRYPFAAKEGATR